MKLGVIWKKRQRAFEVTEFVLLDALLYAVVTRYQEWTISSRTGSGLLFREIGWRHLVEKQPRRAPVLGSAFKPQSATILEVDHESLGSARRALCWGSYFSKAPVRRCRCAARLRASGCGSHRCEPLVAGQEAEPIYLRLRVENWRRRA